MALAGHRRRALGVVGISAALALVLASCAETDDTTGGDGTGGGSGGIKVGTTDVITSLDPAGSYDNGSFAVQNQVYPFLLNSPYGSPDVEPDIAESAEFTSPTEYTVKLKDGLKWANGNDLTASDVKFSFDRQLAIADPNGPSSLLYNLDSTETTDDLTVVFHLKSENDQIFPQILSSPVGPIVDEETFSATELTPSADIVKAKAFAGPYTITDYTENELIQYAAYDGYQGLLGAPKTASVTAQYFTDETSLKLAVQQGDVDVATRSLSPTDLADLRKDEKVKVYDGPGGEIRYIVFNFNTQPFGATTPEADPAKALAVRQAVAHLLDREALSNEIYNGAYTPLYSYVPEGLTGAVEPLKELYGDGNGGPDAAKAKAALEGAGVATPVKLSLQYSPDHYGNSSDEEYAMVEKQLEADGLFDVTLQSTLWDVYSAERTDDLYPAYQLGWFPDYSDADNYLSPFFLKENFLANHYDNAEVNDLILQQATTPDADQRTELIGQIQEKVAQDLSTLPFLQGAQVAVAAPDITGVQDTLDASFKFRYAALGR
ncbi:ABC transporter substrate-binding protein [Georgenia thermotolerans]|uniref:Peptide ABC transporter substrate-binding protein n=1 Tax=Georgenia thermotolerans TaxID=527326 RepID=A0A7J5UMG6_9MICO|nr:ABC transporter substrate-binding protein [Georgenia thermotolerans]KAE8763133.1 peptide ABC transporter substrate-binding protein [Georgenia thermotolerans]